MVSGVRNKSKVGGGARLIKNLDKGKKGGGGLLLWLCITLQKKKNRPPPLAPGDGCVLKVYELLPFKRDLEQMI